MIPTPPITPFVSADLSSGGPQTGDPFFEAWCYDEDPQAPQEDSSCIDPGHANNSGFDLEGSTLTFTPEQGGGFAVTVPEPDHNWLGLVALLVVGGLSRGRRILGPVGV